MMNRKKHTTTRINALFGISSTTRRNRRKGKIFLLSHGFSRKIKKTAVQKILFQVASFVKTRCFHWSCSYCCCRCCISHVRWCRNDLVADLKIKSIILDALLTLILFYKSKNQSLYQGMRDISLYIYIYIGLLLLILTVFFQTLVREVL